VSRGKFVVCLFAGSPIKWGVSEFRSLIKAGDVFEGHTLIPFLKKMQDWFDLKKPIVIADSGLLSKDNILALESAGYK
jgi:hypothetical protein